MSPQQKPARFSGMELAIEAPRHPPAKMLALPKKFVCQTIN